MKRPIFSLIAAVGLPLSVQSQPISGYGIKAGVVSSDMRSPSLGEAARNNRHRKTGVAGLAYLEWGVIRPLSLISEAGYAQRGFYATHEGRDAQNNPIGTVRLYQHSTTSPPPCSRRSFHSAPR